MKKNMDIIVYSNGVEKIIRDGKEINQEFRKEVTRSYSTLFDKKEPVVKKKLKLNFKQMVLLRKSTT